MELTGPRSQEEPPIWILTTKYRFNYKISFELHHNIENNIKTDYNSANFTHQKLLWQRNAYEEKVLTLRVQESCSTTGTLLNANAALAVAFSFKGQRGFAAIS